MSNYQIGKIVSQFIVRYKTRTAQFIFLIIFINCV